MIVTSGPKDRCNYQKEYSKYSKCEINHLDLYYDDNLELIERLIPSKDVRAYHVSMDYKYSSFVTAALISHAEMPFFRTVKELSKLYVDETDLKDQISNYVEYMEYSYKGFVDNSDRTFVYKLVAYDREDEEAECLFANYSDAREYSLRLKDEKFNILKVKIIMNTDEFQEEDDDLYCNECGRASYDEKGNLMSCSLWEIQAPADYNEAFYKAYFYIPFPFRFGDFVRDLRYNEIGMIMGPKDEFELKRIYIDKYTKTDATCYAYDYSDYIINVESLRKVKDDYDWAYDHVSPLELEYAEGNFSNPKEGSIERIMTILKHIKEGKGYLLELEYMIEKYREAQVNEKEERM